jgi:glycerophosphoryl diester phosphodiesterase
MEATHPTRVLTTSVKVSGGDLPLVSVRSNAGIPKARIREAVSLLKQMSLQAPVSLAQVIVKNVLGTDADIVATRCVASVTSAPIEKSQEVEDQTVQATSARQILEADHQPSLYSPAGPCLLKQEVPFPRIVAHRGASAVAPENTLVAFGAALAYGAQEVEFDLRPTADDQAVVCHDETLDRTTTGAGLIGNRTLSYISTLDAGVKFAPQWEGTRVPTLEEAFEFLAGRAVMNIHVYNPGKDAFIIRQIKEFAQRWVIADQIYITGEALVLEAARKLAPEIQRCCLQDSYDNKLFIKRALEFGCQRLQLQSAVTTDQDIRQALEKDLITNYFYCDDVDKAEHLLDAGVMALLTNDCGRMRHLLEDFKSKQAKP